MTSEKGMFLDVDGRLNT